MATLIQTSKGIFIIREAMPTDLPALVDIHVTSWNATYPYYEPKPTRQLREQQWQQAFEKKTNNWFCYVAEGRSGELAGFASAHDFSDDVLPYKGQLDKIHFLKTYQGLGLGRALVRQVAQRFLQQGISSMILFADPMNPAIRFYDHLQGERLKDEDGIFQGAYGWKDTTCLLH